MSTIYILWLRQLKRYFRSRARMIGSLGQPVLFLVALGFGFGPIYAKAGQGSYIQFIAPGVIGMGIIFTAIFSGIEIIWDRQFGFLKETLVAPVSRFNIMLGRTLGGATVAALQGFVVFLLTLLVGFRPTNLWLLPLAFLFMILTAIVFTAFGTALATKLQDMQAFPIIMNFLVMPMFFLSGALFPLKGLPVAIEWIARFNPLAYGVDGMRGTLANAAHFGLMPDVLILSAIAVFFLAIGGYLFSKIEI
ncbi:ABC transporter permease [Candidatus Uhrbacteria bacterium]|nr:ABC transporter permease [Candidatus Uhrbacteria bacterium]